MHALVCVVAVAVAVVVVAAACVDDTAVAQPDVEDDIAATAAAAAAAADDAAAATASVGAVGKELLVILGQRPANVLETHTVVAEAAVGTVAVRGNLLPNASGAVADAPRPDQLH